MNYNFTHPMSLEEACDMAAITRKHFYSLSNRIKYMALLLAPMIVVAVAAGIVIDVVSKFGPKILTQLLTNPFISFIAYVSLISFAFFKLSPPLARYINRIGAEDAQLPTYEMRVSITEDGLRREDQFGYTVTSWDGIQSLIISEKYFFFISGYNGYPLPTSCVGDSVEQAAFIKDMANKIDNIVDG